MSDVRSVQSGFYKCPRSSEFILPKADAHDFPERLDEFRHKEPVVLRGLVRRWPATREWTWEQLADPAGWALCFSCLRMAMWRECWGSCLPDWFPEASIGTSIWRSTCSSTSPLMQRRQSSTKSSTTGCFHTLLRCSCSGLLLLERESLLGEHHIAAALLRRLPLCAARSAHSVPSAVLRSFHTKFQAQILSNSHLRTVTQQGDGPSKLLGRPSAASRNLAGGASLQRFCR